MNLDQHIETGAAALWRAFPTLREDFTYEFFKKVARTVLLATTQKKMNGVHTMNKTHSYATISVMLFYLLLNLSLGVVFAASSHAMPACCWSPKNQWDDRCFGARFHWEPGTSTDDPGTWGPNYSPWQGDCQSYGQSGYRLDPQPPPMCLQIDPTPFPHMAYAPCGWTKEADGHWHAPWNL